jgi:dTDP-4-dehydrorhamnose 3,5-epimerase-like enzyme
MNIINLKNKDILNLPESFKDSRGFIQPLCDEIIKSVSLIKTTAKSWRANHYHKTDWHIIYVISGNFDYYFKKTESDENIKKLNISQNQLLFTDKLINHAMYYNVDTDIIVMSKNPRDQKTYEEDTVRINFMNDSNKF